MSKFLQLEELLSNINDRYKLAIIASKRAKLLNLGAEKKVDVNVKKTTTVALYEAAQKKIEYEEPRKN